MARIRRYTLSCNRSGSSGSRGYVALHFGQRRRPRRLTSSGKRQLGHSRGVVVERAVFGVLGIVKLPPVPVRHTAHRRLPNTARLLSARAKRSTLCLLELA